jgi:hypothetical protein
MGLMGTIMKKNTALPRYFSFFAAITLCLLLHGCATTVDDLIRERYEGKSQIYPVNQETAWDIAKAVLLESGAKLPEIEEERTKNVMNWVSVLGVFVEPVDAERTRVTAQRPPAPCNPLPTPLTEDMFHEQFAKAVSMKKAGKSLPASFPR